MVLWCTTHDAVQKSQSACAAERPGAGKGKSWRKMKALSKHGKGFLQLKDVGSDVLMYLNHKVEKIKQ